MSKIGQEARKILDLLPFNGNKLRLSGIFTLFSVLGNLVPGLSLMDIVQAILANPTRSGIIAVLVSALHKVLKNKFPEVKI